MLLRAAPAAAVRDPAYTACAAEPAAASSDWLQPPIERTATKNNYEDYPFRTQSLRRCCSVCFWASWTRETAVWKAARTSAIPSGLRSPVQSSFRWSYFYAVVCARVTVAVASTTARPATAMAGGQQRSREALTVTSAGSYRATSNVSRNNSKGW